MLFSPLVQGSAALSEAPATTNGAFVRELPWTRQPQTNVDVDSRFGRANLVYLPEQEGKYRWVQGTRSSAVTEYPLWSAQLLTSVNDILSTSNPAPPGAITVIAVVKFNTLNNTTFGSSLGHTIYTQRENGVVDVSPTLCVSDNTIANGTPGSVFKFWFGSDASGTGVGRSNPLPVQTGVWYVVAAAADVNGVTGIAVNGVVGKDVGLPVGTWNSNWSGGPARLGRSTAWGGASPNIEIAFFARFNRTFSNAELSMLTRNIAAPWQVFRPRKKQFGVTTHDMGPGLFLRGVSTAETSPSTRFVNVQRPSGTEPGDLLVAVVYGELNTPDAITAPAGWTKITAASNGDIACFWSVSGNVTNTEFDVVEGGGTPRAHIYAFGGADIFNPVRNANNTYSETNQTTAPSVPAEAGDSLLFIWKNRDPISPGFSTEIDSTDDQIVNRVLTYPTDVSTAGTIVTSTLGNLPFTGNTPALVKTYSNNFDAKRGITIAIAKAPVSETGLRSISSARSDNLSSITGRLPYGTQPTDTLVAVYGRFLDQVLTEPTGWTRYVQSGSENQYWRIYTASAGVQNFTWSTGNNGHNLIIGAFRDRAGYLNLGTTNVAPTSGTLITAPSMIAEAGDTLLTILYGWQVSTPLQAPSPSTITSRYNVPVARGTSGPTILLGTKDNLLAGSTNTYTTNHTEANQFWARIGKQYTLPRPKIRVNGPVLFSTPFGTSHNATFRAPAVGQTLVVCMHSSAVTSKNLTENGGGTWVADLNVTNDIAWFRRVGGSNYGNYTLSFTAGTNCIVQYNFFYLDNVDVTSPLDNTSWVRGNALNNISHTTNYRNSVILSRLYKDSWRSDFNVTGPAGIRKFSMPNDLFYNAYMYLEDAGSAGAKTLSGAIPTASADSGFDHFTVSYRIATTNISSKMFFLFM